MVRQVVRDDETGSDRSRSAAVPPEQTGVATTMNADIHTIGGPSMTYFSTRLFSLEPGQHEAAVVVATDQLT